MKRLSLLTLFVAGAALALAASFLTVDAVMKDPKKHNAKDIVVRGRVSDFNERTSQRGTKYTTFKLRGDKQTLSVYVREHLAKKPKNGDVVEVNGVFRETKNVGQRVFKNEIEATKKEGKKYGVRIISSGR